MNFKKAPKLSEQLPKIIQKKLLEFDRKPSWLAEKAGLTKATISRILAGTAIPNLDTAEEIANALNVSLPSLLSDGSTGGAHALLMSQLKTRDESVARLEKLVADLSRLNIDLQARNQSLNEEVAHNRAREKRRAEGRNSVSNSHFQSLSPDQQNLVLELSDAPPPVVRSFLDRIKQLRVAGFRWGDDEQRLFDALGSIDSGLARQILKMIEPLLADKAKDRGSL